MTLLNDGMSRAAMATPVSASCLANLNVCQGTLKLRFNPKQVVTHSSQLHMMAGFDCHPGLFLSSQVDSSERDAALQRIAAPEHDAVSLDSAVQSATAASDIFMLGAVTYEALVGKPAFPAKNDGVIRGGRWQVQQSHHH